MPNLDDFLLIERARRVAEKAHEGAYRKKTNIPYVTHPFRVAGRVALAGGSPAAIAAAYLHDVVEDTDYDISDFPDEVLEIVALVTRDKRIESKADFIKRTFASGNKDAALVKLADRIDNVEEGVRTIGKKWYKKTYRDSSLLVYALSIKVLGLDHPLPEVLLHKIEAADKKFGIKIEG